MSTKVRISGFGLFTAVFVGVFLGLMLLKYLGVIYVQ